MSSVNVAADAGWAWADVGSKVLCIGRKRRPGEPRVINDHGFKWRPTRGDIYTVRRQFVHETYGLFLFLAEEPEHHAFHAGGFRPAKQAEADARMFLSIANEAEKPLTSLTDALNRAWLAYGVEE